MKSLATTAVRPPAAGDPAAWLHALAFTPRKESWVAAAADRFYKLARAGDNPAQDWLNPACVATAARECADLRRLHRAAANVLQPLRRDHACIVYPRLSGPDLRTALRARGGGEAAGAAGLDAAMRMLAHLHAGIGEAPDYPRKAYLADAWLPPDLDVVRRIAERPRQLCIEGFEVRNFRYDRPRRAWCFFDPQGVSLGVAENDVARFIISVLMVTWGRGGGLRIWTAFDADELVAAYQDAAKRTLDHTLLAYFIRQSIAMRRHFATRALRNLRGARRVLGAPYLLAYFRQLDRWATQHGF